MGSSNGNGEVRSGFVSLGSRGLDWTELPLRLFQKGNAKFWNAADIDFSSDAKEFQSLSEDEQDTTVRLATLFMAGEESVTHDIQPFIRAMIAEGSLADEMYLTQFAFEEARHIEGFRRWLDAIGAKRDLHSYLDGNEPYRKIFYDILPKALRILDDDPSPSAQVRAAVVYNQVVEGVLALTGYHSWRRAAEGRGILPGIQELVRLISQDERRHMAWGTYTCRRHIAADDSNWTVVEQTLEELMMPALGVIDVIFNEYEEAGKAIPFDITREELTGFATTQFSRRLEVIEAARGCKVSEILGAEEEILEEELEREDLNRTPV